MASSGRVADQMVESLHTLLYALLDASSSHDPSDHELILNLLGQRDELMERIRQRVLREDPDMPSRRRRQYFPQPFCSSESSGSRAETRRCFRPNRDELRR
jgi:hypothetical protein